MLPQIKGFLQNSLIDWPGRIASILFLPGCNFRCPFCHAAHLVIKPNEMESIPFESIVEFLQERSDWVDGVIISGGEPTMSVRLPNLVEKIHDLGFPVKLDTNGSHPEVVEDLVDSGAVTAVSMDVKAPLDERYHRLAGVEVDLRAVRRSIEFLLSGAVEEYEFRTTVPPGYLDGDDIEDIARSLGGAKNYVLQNFQPVDCISPSMMEAVPLKPDIIKEYADRARLHVQKCWVRGSEETQPKTVD